MDWDKIYAEWLKEKIDGKVMMSKKMIPKFEKINEYNRELYLEFHNYFISRSDVNLGTYVNYRSKLIDFLTYMSKRQKNICDITQEDLENYLYQFIDKGRASTFNSRVRFIKPFINFHSDKINNKLSFDVEFSKEDVDKDIDNSAAPLSSEQMEFIRNKYIIQPTKLFMFEMVYYTGIKPGNLKKLNYNLFNKETSSFILKNGTEVKVPEGIIYLVERLKDEEFFNSNKNYEDLIKEMKCELREWGVVKNFKWIDITTTYEKTCIRCPECGEKYEAVADNWCVKQYYENSKCWIVCKKCGGINE